MVAIPRMRFAQSFFLGCLQRQPNRLLHRQLSARFPRGVEVWLGELRARCRGRVDVVLSDMAPKLSGIRDRDTARAVELAESGLAIADRLLAPGGRLLLKLFTAPEIDAVVTAARGRFESVKRTHTEATRKGSAEQYLVCVGFRGRPAPSSQESP